MIRFSAPSFTDSHTANTLRARPIGIDTYQEPVVYMRADCPICLSEGFESQSRVELSGNDRSLVATLNVVRDGLLDHGEVGLSDAAWTLLDATDICPVTISHAETLDSFRHVRAKLFGNALRSEELESIVTDVAARRYSDVQLTAFLTSCVGERMTRHEIVNLTRAMVAAGECLDWGSSAVFDKHCVGGLPGNRTTPIVVAIAAACGLVMPKTSSRAITSPAGTADTMETLTRVDLSLEQMRRVVEQEGGCLVWGGAVSLSPADDVLIRVERALDLDSEAQLVASVLSKKIAAGSTHAVIDIPMGSTAKVRDQRTAERLSDLLRCTGEQLGLATEIVVTDGTQPVGRGIGPALEARDVLSVLQGEPDAPQDLRTRATLLAGTVLELSGHSAPNHGDIRAIEALNDGSAWKKFQTICEAQGGLRTPSVAAHRHEVVAAKAGRITSIDNRSLAKVAKLAGAPTAASAGVVLDVHLGDVVEANAAIMTVHAEAPGELAYALDYLSQHTDLVQIDDDPDGAS